MPTIAIAQAGAVLQADTGTSGSSLAQRDSSGNLSMVQCAASSIANSGSEFSTSNTTAATTTYAVAAGDRFIKADAAGGNFTITLPAVASSTGRRLTIIKTTSANTLTIQGNASENINGANTTTLTTQYTSKNLWCDGTQWLSH